MATKPHFWSDIETTYMLNEMKDLNILQLLDGRKHRNGDMFKKLSDKMTSAGYLRSVEQVRSRWKVLRQSYFRAKRQSSSSSGGVNPVDCPYFDTLEDLLGPSHFSAAEGSGVDVGFQELTPSQTVEDVALTPSSPEGVDDTETQDIQVKLESDHFLQSAAQQSPTGSKIRKKRRGKVAQDHYSFMENLQKQHQSWLARQMQQQQERDERFISSLMEANAQATERVVSLMLDGLQKMITPHMNRPHCSTELQHPAQNGISSPQPLIKNEDFEDYETG